MAETQNRDDSDETIFDKLTGTQKSAILMMLIGEDEASEILRNLSPRECSILVPLCIQYKALTRIRLTRS